MKKEKLKEQLNFNTQKLKNNKAITLIALVVTIVVLLILAGISISLVVGDNGLIRKSKDAKKQYEEAQANELAMTDEAGDLIDETVTGVAKPVKVPVGTKASKNGTIDGKEGNANNPTIPKNYTPIDAGEATWGDGTSSPTQEAVDHGLVIKDDSGNEWVWIPVDSTTLGKMVETSTEAKTLCGTTGDTAVTTNKYSKTITIGKDSNTATLSRSTPGKSGNYREPDLVVGNNGTGYDTQDTYYKKILGETGTKEQLAKLFVDEYNEMIASIGKYGGFYIGRYELSGTVTDPTEKSGVTLTKTNWYNLYNACRSSKLQASDKVKTQMIWGIQWDVACDFIANKGEQKNIKDSSNWGNYSDSTGNAKVTVTENGTETKKYGSKQNTGYSEYWKANNIYDLAGNCWEWTQEAYSTNYRAVRGGFCSGGGSSGPASGRNGSGPYGSSYGGVRFSSHFNNKTIERLILTV